MSRRFGQQNKLLARVQGEPIIRRTVRAYLEAGLVPVLVVMGHQAERVTHALVGLDVLMVANPDFHEGQSRALMRGIRALPGAVNAAVIGVGDQPLLQPDVVRRMIARFVEDGSLIVAPRFGGQRGNPVLFGRSLFAELLTVEGDQGGRPVIERHAAEVVWLDVEDPRSGLDVDTIQDLEALRTAAPNGT
jgi:molybdenum cofactor cytidylyltransferase